MLKALKELGKDSLTYGMADAIGKVIGFLLIPLYTAYLTPEDYGVISLLAYLYAFFSPIATLGVTNAIFRRFNLHMNEQDQSLTLSTGSIFVLCTSCILWVIGMYSAPIISKVLVNSEEYIDLTRIAISGACITSIGSVFQVILRAKRRVRMLSKAILVKLFITISLTIYLVVIQGMGVAGVIWSNAIGALFGSLALLILCRNLLKRIFSLIELKALLGYGLPFLPHRIFAQCNSFLGPYLIKEFAGISYAGLYDIALKFSLPLSFVISIIQKSWVPLKFQIHREEGEEQCKNIFTQLITTYFVGIMILFSVVLITGPELIRLMTDLKFHDAVYLFPFVLLNFIGLSAYYMMGTGFEFTNDTRPMPFISFSGLITIIVLSTAFYSLIGIYGILAGIISCQFVMAFVMRLFAISRFKVLINYKVIIGILGALIGSSFLIFFIQGGIFGFRIFISALLFILIFIITVLLFVKIKELQVLKDIDHPLVRKIDQILSILAKKLNFKRG